MIFVNKFRGKTPKVDAKLLPAGFGQEAQNVDLRSGSLKPMKGLTQIQAITKTGDIRTIYKIDDTWIYWTAIVDIVKAQVTNGDFRIAFTGDGYPKQTNKTMATAGAASTYPTTTRRLGIIPPAAALTLEPQGTGDGSVADTVSYLYTYVTAWGEESAPSPATVVQDIEGDQYMRVKGFVIPVLADTGNDIAYFRLYRLASGTTGAEYQLVKARPGAYSASAVYDIPIAGVPNANTYVYDCDDNASPDALNDDLSDILPSEDWDNAPTALDGLVQFQNGILAGFDTDELCPAEPMIPYAFPEDYKATIRDIVALGVYSDALIITTDDFPYIAVGNDPATLMVQILPYNQANLSKRGLISTNVGVTYPTPDGLFLINSVAGTIVTYGIYTKEQWAALSPANLISFYYDEKYYGFFQGTGTGIILDYKAVADESLPFVQDISIADTLFYGGYIDPEDDKLYLLVKEGSTYNIKSWETGADAILSWKSAIFEEPYPINYGWARISGTQTASKAITFKLYADGTLKLTATVTSDEAFRLPSSFLAREWEFTVEGKAEIDSVFIGHTTEEEP